MADDEEYEYDYGSDADYDYGSDADQENLQSDELIEIENLYYGLCICGYSMLIPYNIHVNFDRG